MSVELYTGLAHSCSELPTQQDKLTTWIEYLDYNYYWHQKDLRFLKLLRPQYDEAWSKLRDLFLPNETEEFIWSSASVIQHDRETMQAKSAVESAKRVISDLESCGRSQHQIHREALAAANSTLESGENVLATIQRRNSLVAKFYIQFGQMRKVNGMLQKSYREAEKDARRRSMLLRWILQQLPLIELELENDTSGINCRKRKARDSCDDKFNNLKTAKRQRRAEKSSRKFGPQFRIGFKIHVSLHTTQPVLQVQQPFPTNAPPLIHFEEAHV